MAPLEVTAAVANLFSPYRSANISLLVESRSTLTWLARDLLDELGVQRVSRAGFIRPDGTRISGEIGIALLTLQGRASAVPVVFGDGGQPGILGATALETLGFAVDSLGKKLVPRNLFLLGASKSRPPVYRGAIQRSSAKS
jgi:hypothetical protein